MRFTKQIGRENVSSATFDLDESAGYYDLPFDGGTRILRLNQSALARLEYIIRAGIDIDAPAVEHGGILIGTAARGNSLVTLLDVVPVETEHTLGRAFRPAQSDFAAFSAAIAKHSVRPRRVIGFFRGSVFCNDLLCNDLTCKHPHDFSLRPDDNTLLERCFDPGCLAMLVQPNLSPMDQATRYTASFHLWDDRKEARPIESIRLTGAHAGASVPVKSIPAPVPVAGRPPIQPAALQFPAGKVRSYKRALIGAAAAIVLPGVFALGWFAARNRPAAPVPPSLSLQAEAHGSNVDFAWNPASSAIRGSGHGALDIFDGVRVSRVDLNRAQLRAGHYQYAAIRPDITCVITVYRDNDGFVGAAQHIRLNLPRTGTADAPDPPPDVPSPEITLSLSRPPVRDLPELKSPGANSAGPMAPPAIAAVTETPQPADLSAPAFSPAVPVARVVPRIPPETGLQLHEPVTIRLSLLVSTEGRVTGAHPVDVTNLTGKILAMYAEQAALQWHFAPAQRNGIPVDSETVVSFKFGRRE